MLFFAIFFSIIKAFTAILFNAHQGLVLYKDRFAAVVFMMNLDQDLK